MASKYEAIDAVTVPTRITRDGRDEQFGGLSYVMGLPDAVPGTTAAIRHYVQVVNRAAAARRAIEVLLDVTDRIWSGLDPADHIGAAADELMRLADERDEQPEIHTLRESKQAVLNRMDSGAPDRVTFFDDQGRLRSLLASWTNVDEPDAFTQCSAGRSWLRVDDLLHLRALVEEIAKGQRTRRRTR